MTSESSSLTWLEHGENTSLATSMEYLLNRPKYLSRVIERVAINGEIISREVTFNVASGPNKHLVLLAAPARGKLIDLLNIDASHEYFASPISRDDTALICKLILEQQCANLGANLSSPLVDLATSVAEVPFDESRELLTILQRLATTNSDLVPDDDSLELKKLADSQDFLKLFRFFRTHRPIWIPVFPNGISFTVKFAFETGRQEYSVSSGRELFRGLFGLSSYDLMFPIFEAVRAQTFHFRLRAPQNHYVSHCKVLTTDALWDERTAPTDLVATKPYSPARNKYAQYQSKDADGLVHVYLTDIYRAEKNLPPLFVHVRFAERPFGQTGAALWRWALVASFLLTIARLGARLVETQSTLGVSLLLAIPAILGVSTLTTVTLGALNAPSGARIASILSGIAALVGALSLVDWNTSYSRCIKNSFANCSTGPPPGANTALWIVGICTAVLIAYCLFCIAFSTRDYHLAKKLRNE